jgi:hypothetical protein
VIDSGGSAASGSEIMAWTTKVSASPSVASQPRVRTPGSEPPLNQMVGHAEGSNPIPPTWRESTVGKGPDNRSSNIFPRSAKARQTSSGEANHHQLQGGEGGHLVVPVSAESLLGRSQPDSAHTQSGATS